MEWCHGVYTIGESNANVLEYTAEQVHVTVTCGVCGELLFDGLVKDAIVELNKITGDRLVVSWDKLEKEKYM